MSNWYTNETIAATKTVAAVSGGLVVWGLSLSEWAALASILVALFVLVEKAPTVFSHIIAAYKYTKKNIREYNKKDTSN